ncbi:MAG TPA: ABC transporter permease [Ktedonobacterales bacterium]|nr:ABC transporter permease [Ktedonobacterales bacterium]
MSQSSSFTNATFWLFCRAWQKTLRLPLVLALVLALPAVTLWLLSQIFASIHQTPGFSAMQSLSFFAPGMLVIAALFGSSFAGIGLLGDHDSGVLERLTAAPIHRSAILLGKALADGSRTLLQALTLLILLAALHTPIDGGPLDLLSLLALLAVFSLAFAGLSYLIALLTSSTEALMLIEMFLFLLLLFGSNALLPDSLLPGWMSIVSLVNPVSHTVSLARQLLAGTAEPLTYSLTIGALALLASLGISAAALKIKHIT